MIFGLLIQGTIRDNIVSKASLSLSLKMEVCPYKAFCDLVIFGYIYAEFYSDYIMLDKKALHVPLYICQYTIFRRKKS